MQENSLHRFPQTKDNLERRWWKSPEACKVTTAEVQVEWYINWHAAKELGESNLKARLFLALQRFSFFCSTWCWSKTNTAYFEKTMWTDGNHIQATSRQGKKTKLTYKLSISFWDNKTTRERTEEIKGGQFLVLMHKQNSPDGAHI